MSRKPWIGRCLTAVAIAATGCGTTRAAGASSVAETDNANELLTQSARATVDATSVRVIGTVPVRGGVGELSMRLSRHDATGTIVSGNVTLPFEVIRGVQYLKLTARSAKHFLNVPFSMHKATWIRSTLPNTRLIDFITPFESLTALAHLVEVGRGREARKTSVVSVDGTHAMRVAIGAKAHVDVALTGTPYPVDLTSRPIAGRTPRGSVMRLRFAAWDQRLRVVEPPHRSSGSL